MTKLTLNTVEEDTHQCRNRLLVIQILSPEGNHVFFIRFLILATEQVAPVSQFMMANRCHIFPIPQSNMFLHISSSLELRKTGISPLQLWSPHNSPALRNTLILERFKEFDFELRTNAKFHGTCTLSHSFEEDFMKKMSDPRFLGARSFPSDSSHGKNVKRQHDINDGVEVITNNTKKSRGSEDTVEDIAETLEMDQYHEVSPSKCLSFSKIFFDYFFADLDYPDRHQCEISSLPEPLDNSPSFGKPVAACIFTCVAHDGPKNLRQKASLFEVTIPSTQDNTKHCETKYVKFKIYADSTIKRGKKNLRRNCFFFPFSDGRILHIMSTNHTQSRKSLKWTVEKKERFLAFEGGSTYFLRVFSTHLEDKVVVNLKQNGSLISEWKDLYHADRNFECSASSVSPTRSNGPFAVADWELEPSTWNLSLNCAPKFYATVISREHQLPLVPPKVVLVAKDKKIDVKIEQYDHRYHRSFLISIPRLFSTEKVEEATAKGVQHTRDVDLSISDPSGQLLWSTNFTYEVGFVEAEAEAEEPKDD